MARSLPVLSSQAITGREYKFFDWVRMEMPMRAGDGAPIVFYSSKANFKMAPIEDMTRFILEIHLSAFHRMPTESEFNSWTDALTPFSSDPVGYLSVVTSKIGPDIIDLYPAAKSDYQFLTDLYNCFLNRTPIAQERSNWDGLYDGVPLDRAAITHILLTNTEFEDRVVHTIQPRQFNAEIKSMPELTIQDGRAMDNFDIVLNNRNELYSGRLSEYDRRLSPVKVIAGRAFYVGSGTYERNIILKGTAQVTKITLSELSFSATSIMSRQGIKVVKEVTQRCALVYRGKGCDTQDLSPTCSRRKDDTVDGCASKDPAPDLVDGTNPDNRASFGGVVQGGAHPDTHIGGTGDPPWTTGGGTIHAPCFLDGTMITLADGSYLPIELCEEDMSIQCPVWDGKYLKIKIGKILEVHKNIRPNWATAIFDDDKDRITRVAPEHRYFSVDSRDWEEIKFLFGQGRAARREGNTWKNVHLKDFNVIHAEINVTNLTTEWETFLADDMAVHNTKITPIENPV